MNLAISRDDMDSFFAINHIDLSKLPAPKIIEELDFEEIFKEIKEDFLKRNPSYTALLESDPVMIALESCAYREMLLRNRINEAAKANMLAYAKGEDLDNLAATLYYTKRLIINKGDSEAIPPIPPTYESDSRLRLRTQLAMESFTTAGSELAYLFHSLSASAEVKSVSVKSPAPGDVLITILSTQEKGVANEELINTVKSYLTEEKRRPLTDRISVQSASILEYEVKAKIHVYQGPVSSIIQKNAKAELEKYVAKRHKIGEVIACSGIHDSLHMEGVKKVELIKPTEDIITTKEQAGYCTKIELEIINDG